MAAVQYENYCETCGHIIVRETPDRSCPDCGQEMQQMAFVTCQCGEQVYVPNFTNECDKCGALYNKFGQRLAPVSEWDPEDVYATFGPQ